MIKNDSEFICDMNYFMFSNNYLMSENFRYLSTKYKISIYEWRGDVSKIIKLIMYFCLNNITCEHYIIYTIILFICFCAFAM